MSTGSRFVLPYATVADVNGVPITGAQLAFYVTGTSTPANTYQDQGLTTPNTNPVVSGTNGFAVGTFGNIFLDPTVIYKAVLEDSLGNVLWTADPLATSGASSGLIVTVANVSALRALTSVPGNVIQLLGYSTFADGGEGIFLYDSSDNTSADNGGTIFVDAVGHRYYRSFEAGDFNALWFGVVGDGATDNSTAVQNAVNAAAGNQISFPVGRFCFHGITSAVPVNIQGAGMGAGPGSAEQSNPNMTQFLINSSTSDLFTITSNYPSIFRDFHVGVLGANQPMTSGVGIHLIGAGGATVSNPKINNVAFSAVYNPIRILRPAWPEISGCYFDTWLNNGLYFETSSGIEGSGGFINDNFFFGTSSTTSPAIYSEVGYTIIQSNEILGGNACVQFNIKNYSAGFIKIADNTIEDFGTSGVSISSGDGSTAAMVMIQDNEFSVNANVDTTSISINEYVASPAWITDIVITGNISRNTSAAGAKHIWVQAGKNVVVSDNIIDELGTNSGIIGVQITGNTTNAGLIAPIQVLDNTFIGDVSSRYQFTNAANIVVRDLVGLTYANLPSYAGVGSLLYVTDGQCTSATNPVVIGGGSGCTAARVRTNWYSQQYGVTG